ncbi:MAG TPA: DUF6496 domain-containing protein [Devosia sp.]|jgi:phage repressor protein C with HTH and peptisase S24 domain|nr:DUF6496 domain-containing protein [Devosia sp.]
MPQSKAQKATTERVMHEFKEGELESSNGRKVKSRKQAIAIALSESGSSNRNSPKKNRENLSKTKSKERAGQTAQAEKEGKAAQRRTLAKGAAGTSRRRTTGSSARQGGPTKSELYEQAKKRNIEGRSKMSKGELQRALG